MVYVSLRASLPSLRLGSVDEGCVGKATPGLMPDLPTLPSLPHPLLLRRRPASSGRPKRGPFPPLMFSLHSSCSASHQQLRARYSWLSHSESSHLGCG